jgi:hypothetical protein
LAIGFWLLAFGFWLLAFGYWLLARSLRRLPIVHADSLAMAEAPILNDHFAAVKLKGRSSTAGLKPNSNYPVPASN